MCVQKLSQNKIKEYILGRYLACVKEGRKEGRKERKKERTKERKKKERKKEKKQEKKNERTNEQTDGRTDKSTNESILARLLDVSCFVVCRSTVQKHLVIIVVKV